MEQSQLLLDEVKKTLKGNNSTSQLCKDRAQHPVIRTEGSEPDSALQNKIQSRGLVAKAVLKDAWACPWHPCPKKLASSHAETLVDLLQYPGSEWTRNNHRSKCDMSCLSLSGNKPDEVALNLVTCLQQTTSGQLAPYNEAQPWHNYNTKINET